MNKLYSSLLILSGSFFASAVDAQNVRVIQTSTNPQPRQVNTSPVIVIPKTESNSAQQNNSHSPQKENPNRSVRKVENKNQSQGNSNKNQVNRRGR